MSPDSAGNVFVDASLEGNGEYDARDDDRPGNVWLRTDCTTDSPPGTICEHP